MLRHKQSERASLQLELLRTCRTASRATLSPRSKPAGFTYAPRRAAPPRSRPAPRYALSWSGLGFGRSGQGVPQCRRRGGWMVRRGDARLVPHMDAPPRPAGGEAAPSTTAPRSRPLHRLNARWKLEQKAGARQPRPGQAGGTQRLPAPAQPAARNEPRLTFGVSAKASARSSQRSPMCAPGPGSPASSASARAPEGRAELGVMRDAPADVEAKAPPPPARQGCSRAADPGWDRRFSDAAIENDLVTAGMPNTGPIAEHPSRGLGHGACAKDPARVAGPNSAREARRSARRSSPRERGRRREGVDGIEPSRRIGPDATGIGEQADAASGARTPPRRSCSPPCR